MSEPIKPTAHDLFQKWLKVNPKSSFCTYFEGRIEAVTRSQDQEGKPVFEHEIVCKPVDEFASPARIIFPHQTRLASKGEIITAVVHTRLWLDRPVISKKTDSDGVHNTWKPQRVAIQFVELL